MTTAVATRVQPVRLIARHGRRLRFTIGIVRDGAAVNLTGYTARLVARRYSDAPTTLLDLGMAAADQTGITIAASTGKVTVNITPASTGAWTWRHGVWELSITDAGGTDPLTVLIGEIVVDPSVVVGP